jgi:arabinan endo-1,5-alpha-L-arabinosidase
MRTKGTIQIFSVLIFLVFAIPGFGQTKGEKAIMSIGKFERIFDQSIGEDDVWYMNDHCFIQGPDGKWHMIGITGRDAPKPWAENYLAHAVADSLTGKWVKKPYAMAARNDLSETVLWAPYIIKHDDTYYMFYCGGDPDHKRYQINLATSKDLYEWSRYTENPLFVDGFDGRDPYVFHDEINNRWILYYTATSKPEGGAHIVGARISYDLVHWTKDRYVVFTDPERGTWGGNTESPVVIKRGDWYYLFIGPGANYITTKVYRSKDLFYWEMKDEVATLETHAAEIVKTADGKWFISHCGLKRGGLYMAPFFWHDEVQDKLDRK